MTASSVSASIARRVSPSTDDQSPSVCVRVPPPAAGAVSPLTTGRVSPSTASDTSPSTDCVDSPLTAGSVSPSIASGVSPSTDGQSPSVGVCVPPPAAGVVSPLTTALLQQSVVPLLWQIVLFLL